MKKYRLKQWYPSLGGDFKIGEKIIFWEERGCYVKNFGDDISLRKTEVENNPDFWEEVEEPLFVTEDGVECFDGDEYILIGDYYSKIYMVAYNRNAPYSSGVKKFKHKSNADEYIWKNKPLFSYEDFMKWGNVPYERVIMQLAKERIEE